MKARSALLLCAVFASSCGRSGGEGALPGGQAQGPISISASGGTISLTVGATVSVTVGESNYNGAFFASSLNTSVATVTPSTASTSAQAIRHPLETGVASFRITAVGVGNTTLVFSDQAGHGAATAVNVVAATPGVNLSPTSLAFDAVGAAYAQTVNAIQPGFSGAFSESGTTCNGIATISQTGASTFTITPAAAGICSYDITGNGQSATLDVTVTVTNVGGS